MSAISIGNPWDKERSMNYTKMAGAKTQSEVDVYARQIKSVDEAIDTLVYALYGLSPEEINIGEGHG